MASVLRSLMPLVALAGMALAGPKSCPSNIPLSCHNTTEVADTCCFIPAGQLLQTQFWDTNPVTGPTDSWTIHGLWPDNCDGTYPAQCDTSRAYTNISDILSSTTGGSDTLAYMKTYWKDYKGDDESFWQHEWGKHGTCISTLDPSCYSGYKPTEEATAFFARTVALFKTLPTYQWLADAGITPSSSRTYALADVQAALQNQHGAKVTLSCRGKALNEVWYHFNVQGSLQQGKFVAAQPDGAKGKCPSKVQYRPKSGDGGS
ncbi:Ribonuclease Trv [Tolypocladium ophioglossoides CBS 100239]|uniref:ribonuclease T2 n=1 Tax=Tolypocladium ophioglossoides (strain CBS 100239) TaxID=1163406 RepID=A0A0L0NDF0_TOLOC|nr:Ribonuclease Trv [Tolypocladium ophioglossoides CBS 100239]